MRSSPIRLIFSSSMRTSAFHVRSAVQTVPFLMTLVVIGFLPVFARIWLSSCWKYPGGLGAGPQLVGNLRSLHDRMHQHIGPRRGPVLGNLLGLVVAQPVDAGAHHHRCRRYAVDPAGVMA